MYYSTANWDEGFGLPAMQLVEEMFFIMSAEFCSGWIRVYLYLVRLAAYCTSDMNIMKSNRGMFGD